MMSIDNVILDEDVIQWMVDMKQAKGIHYNDLAWYDSNDRLLLSLLVPNIDLIASQWVLCAVTPRDEPSPRRFDLYATQAENGVVPISFQLAVLGEKTLPKRLQVTTKVYGTPEVIQLSTPLREDYLNVVIMLGSVEIIRIELWESGEITTESSVLTRWSQDNLRQLLTALFQREANGTASS